MTAVDEREPVRHGRKMFLLKNGFYDLPLNFCKGKLIDFNGDLEDLLIM